MIRWCVIVKKVVGSLQAPVKWLSLILKRIWCDWKRTRCSKKTAWFLIVYDKISFKWNKVWRFKIIEENEIDFFRQKIVKLFWSVLCQIKYFWRIFSQFKSNFIFCLLFCFGCLLSTFASSFMNGYLSWWGSGGDTSGRVMAFCLDMPCAKPGMDLAFF